MCPVRQRGVHGDDDALDLVPASPLRIARVVVDPPDVLAHLWLDALEEEVVDRVQRVREDELRPREDAQLVAHRVEVVSARQLV